MARRTVSLLALLAATTTAVVAVIAGADGADAALHGGKAGPCPGCTAVFYSGLNGSACYRIPSIIRTRRGTLLAFAENRMTDCGDNGKHHALVRS